jgi:hypothetical protein
VAVDPVGGNAIFEHRNYPFTQPLIAFWPDNPTAIVTGTTPEPITHHFQWAALAFFSPTSWIAGSPFLLALERDPP